MDDKINMTTMMKYRLVSLFVAAALTTVATGQTKTNSSRLLDNEEKIETIISGMSLEEKRRWNRIPGTPST